ncbi:DUF2975 domain-containing protein [Candidatus Nomurabacteria bacterium]|nr:DUF2975 domain-containing protein [Candidatus Nomurabacteria bacterium]
MKENITKKGSTLFLKFALIILAFIAVVFCLILFFGFEGEGIRHVPYLQRFLDPFLILMFSTVIPFYVALIQAWKLLTYIDQSLVFSENSVQALKNIKYCGVVMSLIYASAMPIVFRFAEQDDAPGVIIVWAAIIGAPIVVSVFAAVLEKLVRSAIDIKTENDLTV